MSGEAVTSAFVAGVICVFLASVITNGCTRDAWKKEAVARGFAEYSVDTDGKISWKWKELPEKP